MVEHSWGMRLIPSAVPEDRTRLLSTPEGTALVSAVPSLTYSTALALGLLREGREGRVRRASRRPPRLCTMHMSSGAVAASERVSLFPVCGYKHKGKQ